MSNGSAHATSDDIPPTYHAELPRLKKNEVCLAYHEDEEAGFRYRKCVLPQNRHVQVRPGGGGYPYYPWVPLFFGPPTPIGPRSSSKYLL